MTEPNKDVAIAQIATLITSYCFDLDGYTAEESIARWRETYSVSWIRLAAIEALYLGRYKAVSIEQILSVWSRLENPSIHFNCDFERLICRNLPRHLANESNKAATDVGNEDAIATASIESDRTKFQANSQESILKQSLTFKNKTKVSSARSNSKQDKSSSSDRHQTKGILEKEGLDRVNWSRGEGDPAPIHRFIPLPDFSKLYFKLKAVAQKELEEV